MIFFYRQNKYNEKTSTEKLNKELGKQRKFLYKKETKLGIVQAKMDNLYNQAISCRKEILKLQGEGQIAAAAKKGSLKLDLTKKHSIIQKKYIAMSREVEFIRQRVKKLVDLLEDKKAV